MSTDMFVNRATHDFHEVFSSCIPFSTFVDIRDVACKGFLSLLDMPLKWNVR